ncbi:MAG: hypothetical protein ACQESN_03750 [Thermotogota bacterium]
MDFFNINSNLINNSKNNSITNGNNKVKAKVLFANKDSLIVNYKGKVLLLENKSDIPLKPGMIINLSFEDVKNTSNNKILTKALGQILDNMFNLNLKINDTTLSFDINLENIPDAKKASFIKWLSDFFTTLDKKISDNIDNSKKSILSPEKIKFFLKNIIEDIAKNFTKNKTINPDPIQLAKNIAKKLFNLIDKNTNKKNASKETINSRNTQKKLILNNTNIKEKNIPKQKQINAKNNKTIILNKNNTELKNNTINAKENSSKNLVDNTKHFLNKTNNTFENKNLTSNNTNNISKSDVNTNNVDIKNRIVSLLNNDNAITKNQIVSLLDKFVFDKNKQKPNLFFFINNENKNSFLDSFSKLLLKYHPKFSKDSSNILKSTLVTKENQTNNIPIKKQSIVKSYLSPKIIIKSNLFNKTSDIPMKNNITKEQTNLNKFFLQTDNIKNKNELLNIIKKSFNKTQDSMLKNNNIITNNKSNIKTKNMIILDTKISEGDFKLKNTHFKLIFNHNNLNEIEESLKDIMNNEKNSENKINTSNNSFMQNTISKAISAYQNMETMKNLSDSSYMMFNMLGIPVYLSFNKEEIVNNEKSSTSKSYGKIRLILPTETFGITDINIFVNEKEAYLNIKMQENIEYFESNLDSLKNKIEKQNIKINSLSIKQDTDLINIEKEVSIS